MSKNEDIDPVTLVAAFIVIGLLLWGWLSTQNSFEDSQAKEKRAKELIRERLYPRMPK